MRKYIRVFLALITIFIVVIGYFYYEKWKLTPGYLEITQASIWGDLQGIEVRHRSDSSLQVPLLLKGAAGSENYDVLGVRSDDQKKPYVWIVLNVDAGANGIFSMPHNANYSIPCTYLESLKAREPINAHVMMALTQHCTK